MQQHLTRRRSQAAFSAVVLMTTALFVLSSTLHVAAFQGTPAATPATGETIELIGLVEHPAVLTVADLRAFPTETVDVTFESGDGTQQHSYTGVHLAAVIEQAGLTLDPDQKNDQLRSYLVLTAKDGYEVVISWGEIDLSFGAAPYLLAWEEDGQTLTGDDGPVRLVTPGDVRGGRYVSGLIRIEVRNAGNAPGA